MLFKSGDKGRLRWFFRICENYNQPSGGDGCYIHQLHSVPYGPIVKVMLRSGNRLDVTHDPKNQNDDTERSLGSIDFAPHRGVWLAVDERLECRNHGVYALTITRVDNGERIYHQRRT